MINDSQKRFRVARVPVMYGPIPELKVLTMLIVPMTAVRSAGRMTAAKKADRGATSIDWVHARRIRKSIAKGSCEGKGIKASAIEEGRWVNTIV
jgi:hypothetical protein